MLPRTASRADNFADRCRLRMRSDRARQHPICHRDEVRSSIKALNKGAQLAVSVFFKAQGVEGAAKTCFQIVQYCVDPTKFRQLVRMSTSFDYRLMEGTDFLQGAEAGQSI